MTYETPKMEILSFEESDIIRTSGATSRVDNTTLPTDWFTDEV